MRRRIVALALVLVVSTTWTTAAAAAPDRKGRVVRVFAVQPRISADWLASREAYRAKLFALFDRRLRGDGAPLVQDGADDVAAHLTGRDLVALPEDLGLMAVFTGSRGALGRQVTPQTGGLTAAIALVAASYAPQVAYYAARHPALALRGIPTRAVALALTDTFARVGVETFAELADRYDVWLEAGVNMARSWRIVCTDRASYLAPPTGEPCAVEDPVRVALLNSGDDAGRGYAYEATTDEPVNMALVFDPGGRLVSRQIKTYLTPLELPGGLDLVPGTVSGGLAPLRTPVGTLGIVTSKDAWMPDVVQKLDQGGVDLLIQPEFFVGDTLRTSGMWAPDTLIASGWADVVRHPSIEALVLPEMTGNVIDVSADAQSHVVVEPGSRTSARSALAGQPAQRGFALVAPYVVPDPARAGEPIGDRRRRLGEAGEALLPPGPPCSSASRPGPCAGGHVEGVFHADVVVARRPARRPVRRRRLGHTPFSVNAPIAPSPRVQRNVALAAHGRVAYAVFEERQAGRWRVRLARSADGGRTWSRSRALPAGGAEAEQWWPAVAAGPDGRAWLVWQERGGAAAPWRLRAAVTSPRGGAIGQPYAVDSPPGADHQWKPAVAAGRAGEAVVAWIDERGRTRGDARLPRAAVRVARLRPEGADAGRAMAAPAPVELARSLEHAWAPSLAARGGDVVLAWLDFRDYDWDVWSAVSSDGGGSWAPPRPVGGAPAGIEALDDAPDAALTDDGPLVGFVDWRKDDATARTPHPLYDIAVAAPGDPARIVDAHDGAPVASFAPALLALPAGGALLGWQDHARGWGAIAFRRLLPGGRAGRVRRIDDRGARAGGRWRPALALAGGTVLAAWEDDRDGPRQVFAARAPVRTLG